MRASELGIENLKKKKIVPNLIQWSGEDTKDYSELRELYDNVGYSLEYIVHVTANVGEYMSTTKLMIKENPFTNM